MPNRKILLEKLVGKIYLWGKQDEIKFLSEQLDVSKLNDFYEIELIKFKNDIYDFDDKSAINLTNLFIILFYIFWQMRKGRQDSRMTLKI